MVNLQLGEMDLAKGKQGQTLQPTITWLLQTVSSFLLSKDSVCGFGLFQDLAGQNDQN